MEFTIEFGGELHDVTITTSGVADIAGLRYLNTELASDSRYRAGLSIFAEYSNLDMSGLSDSDIEQIAVEIDERDWHSPPRAVAIVASNLETFTRMRMVVAHLGGSQSHRRVFTSREAAVAWLHQQQ